MTTLPFSLATASGRLMDLAFVLVFVVGPIAYKWAKQRQAAALALYRAHTTAQQRVVLDGLAKDAAAWAERFASSPAGEQKMKQAIAFVQKALGARGITLDVQEVIGAIQAAVAAAKTSGVLAAAGPTLAVQPAPAPVAPARPTPPAPAPQPATVPVAPGGPEIAVPVAATTRV